MEGGNQEVEGYCIYCGQDLDKPHDEFCPLIAGMPEGVYGFTPIEGDDEWNLHLGRMRILMRWTKNSISSGDDEIDKRLVFEHAKFVLSRFRFDIYDILNWSKSKNPIRRLLAQRKKKELKKVIVELKEFSEVYGDNPKVDELLSDFEELLK